MALKKFATLTIRLKGFVEPDTSSQFEGYLEPGEYLVEEVLLNHPNADSDYAKILSPILGDGDTWICTRWKTRQYATIQEKEVQAPERVLFEDDDLVIPESRLIDLLPSFHEFTYDPDKGRYPFDLNGYRVPQAPPATNNCCTFVEALVVRAWQDEHPEIQWDSHRHGQMMILSLDDYFSPVTALIESDIAEVVDNQDNPPHPWTVIQGWRKNWTSGHTFIIVDHHPETDKVLTLESNSAFRLDGVGYRMIGNLADFNVPPANWWEREELWSWERIVSTYQHRRQAILKVRNRQWSGLG
jgi:hypothetical protein